MFQTVHLWRTLLCVLVISLLVSICSREFLDGSFKESGVFVSYQYHLRNNGELEAIADSGQILRIHRSSNGSTKKCLRIHLVGYLGHHSLFSRKCINDEAPCFILTGHPMNPKKFGRIQSSGRRDLSKADVIIINLDLSYNAIIQQLRAWKRMPNVLILGHGLENYKVWHSYGKFWREVKFTGTFVTEKVSSKNILPENYFSTGEFPFKGSTFPEYDDVVVPLSSRNNRFGDKMVDGAIWPVSRCTVRFRNEFAKEFAKAAAFPVHIVGGCANLRNRPARDPSMNPIREAAAYRFRLSLENSIAESYLTEKLIDPLKYGQIPIYLGDPTAINYIPINSTIFVRDFKKVEDLTSYVSNIMQNETLFNSFHAWRHNATEIDRLKEIHKNVEDPWICRAARFADGLLRDKKNVSQWDTEIQEWK